MNRMVMVVVALSLPSVVSAKTLRVPSAYGTIQAAVDAAQDGDTVLVWGGSRCGATVSKKLTLKGEHGATIIGCAAPTVAGFRAGFFLPDATASGTRIEGFKFDGRGISNTNTNPLAFAVFARHADHVRVQHNQIEGTVQGITNTAGSFWEVLDNGIEGLTAFTCDGFCGGGVGISFTQSDTSVARAGSSVIAYNEVRGKVPNNLSEFAVAGIFFLGQDGNAVIRNKLSIKRNSQATADSFGLEMSDQCCGGGVASPTTINTTVLFNDAHKSGIGFKVDPDFSGGFGNLVGAHIALNRGTVDLGGGSLPPVAAPSEPEPSALVADDADDSDDAVANNTSAARVVAAPSGLRVFE